MPRTVEQGFEVFLNGLAALNSEHAKAASHKHSVESCLYSKLGCYDMHETGSFGNGTGVRHHSDTDYFAVLSKDHMFKNSALVLREVREAVEDRFYSTSGICVRTPAVRIPFGTYESETMEVTPCFYNGMVEFDGVKYPAYQIPDNSGGWMQSSPKVHNAYVKNIDVKLNFKVKKLVQIIKAWKYYNNVPIKSFYLEMYVSRYAYSESAIVYSIDVKNILEKLIGDKLVNIYDPTGVSGFISPTNSSVQHADAMSKLGTALRRAVKAKEYEYAGDIDSAFECWDRLFDYYFPVR